MIGVTLVLLGPLLPLAVAANTTGVAPCPPRASDQTPLIDAASLGQLERCLQQLPQTRALHWQQQGYTPQREQLHRQILDRTRTHASCVKAGTRPLAVFTAGPPGAGKSTWLAKHVPALMQPGWLRIDADAVREQLPEYQGWNAAQTHDETGDLVNALLGSIGQPCKANVIYDGTLASPKRYLTLIPKLKQLGYRTFIVQVMVPEAVSNERALARYRRSGRYVPMEVIRSYFKKAAATFSTLKNKVDGTIQVDGLSNQIVSQTGTKLPLLMQGMTP